MVHSWASSSHHVITAALSTLADVPTDVANGNSRQHIYAISKGSCVVPVIFLVSGYIWRDRRNAIQEHARAPSCLLFQSALETPFLRACCVPCLCFVLCVCYSGLLGVGICTLHLSFAWIWGVCSRGASPARSYIIYHYQTETKDSKSHCCWDCLVCCLLRETRDTGGNGAI